MAAVEETYKSSWAFVTVVVNKKMKMDRIHLLFCLHIKQKKLFKFGKKFRYEISGGFMVYQGLDLLAIKIDSK
jgi:hypothetical protein